MKNVDRLYRYAVVGVVTSAVVAVVSVLADGSVQDSRLNLGMLVVGQVAGLVCGFSFLAAVLLRLRSKGRSLAWAAALVLGPIGLILIEALQNRSPVTDERGTSSTGKGATVTQSVDTGKLNQGGSMLVKVAILVNAVFVVAFFLTAEGPPSGHYVILYYMAYAAPLLSIIALWSVPDESLLGTYLKRKRLEELERIRSLQKAMDD